MATQTGVFDMYYLLVELLFGNLLAAGTAVGFLILCIAFITRMSPMLWGFILLLFGMVFLGGYFGGIWVALPFIISLVYFVVSMWLAWSKYRG